MSELRMDIPTNLLQIHGTPRQLQSMEQGIWKAQLQQTEETTRLGWLLFSADEFNKDMLKSQIWETTGVQVALQYWAIDNGTTKQDAANQKRVKVLHIEIDKG